MKLNYQSLGSGKAIIILHGLFGSSDNWLGIGKKLAADYKVYLVDQRNHGDSPHDEQHSYKLMAADLKQFIQEHAIDNPHIIGHSMGGKAAMFFAVQNPELFDKLIVVDIAPKAYKVHHQDILEGLKSIDLPTLKSRKAADEQLEKFVPDQGTRMFLLKSLNRDGENKYSWKLNLPIVDSTIEEISAGLDLKSLCDKPTLFISGGKSNYIQEQDRELIMKFFPQARIKVISGAGHWIHAENPEEFLEVVEGFLCLYS